VQNGNGNGNGTDVVWYRVERGGEREMIGEWVMRRGEAR
tara:strand:- start:616 stop:732 length:117 start_codon:yes stop_codon:yes gene_type:complete